MKKTLKIEHKTSIERRKFVVGSTAAAIAAVSPNVDAFVLPWVVRFFFRGAVKKKLRKQVRSKVSRSFRQSARRVTSKRAKSYATNTRRVSTASGSPLTSKAMNIYDGYHLLSLLQSSDKYDPSIYAVSDRIAEQIKHHQPDHIFIKGKRNPVQLAFFNDSEEVISSPTIKFEETNLTTGDQFVRASRIRMRDNLLPGAEGSLPSKTSRYKSIPIVLGESGVIQIQPFVTNNSFVIFEPLLFVVADENEVQIARS